MARTEEMSALDRALATCRAQHQASIERAERILEGRRNEHYQTINRSAKRVGELVSHLEFLEFFERERDAARTRLELHAAEMDHRATVEAANRGLKASMRYYVRDLRKAGTALEAAFEAAAGPSDSV